MEPLIGVAGRVTGVLSVCCWILSRTQHSQGQVVSYNVLLTASRAHPNALDDCIQYHTVPAGFDCVRIVGSQGTLLVRALLGAFYPSHDAVPVGTRCRLVADQLAWKPSKYLQTITKDSRFSWSRDVSCRIPARYISLSTSTAPSALDPHNTRIHYLVCGYEKPLELGASNPWE